MFKTILLPTSTKIALTLILIVIFNVFLFTCAPATTIWGGIISGGKRTVIEPCGLVSQSIGLILTPLNALLGSFAWVVHLVFFYLLSCLIETKLKLKISYKAIGLALLILLAISVLIHLYLRYIVGM